MKSILLIILLTLVCSAGSMPKSQQAPHRSSKLSTPSRAKMLDDSIQVLKKELEESYLLSKQNVETIQAEIKLSEQKERDLDRIIKLVKSNQNRLQLSVSQIQIKEPDLSYPDVKYTVDSMHQNHSTTWFKRKRK